MDPHPVQLFYRKLGHLLRPYMNTTEFDPETRCSDCDVVATQWPEPCIGVVFKQYGNLFNHCTACHSLYQGSFDLLGIESYRSGKPVAGKFGMMKGCGALVSDSTTTLFMNATYKKVLAAPNPPQVAMEKLFGRAAHDYVLSNPPAEPFLYIGDFGVKKDKLIASLAMSTPSTLKVCSDAGVRALPLAVTRDLVDAVEPLSQAMLNKLKGHLSLQLKGLQSPTHEKALKDFEKAAEQSPGLFPALRRLPADPHQVLDMLSYI